MAAPKGAGACAELLATHAAEAGLASALDPAPRTHDLTALLGSNPFLMAPMAGVSDAAYRVMARAGGAGFAYTEMVSVAGIHFSGEKTWELVIPDECEPDIAVQLFGSDPSQFAEAATAVQERLGNKLLLIDVNMACPVPKVTRKGEGSALMGDPDRAAEIVRAVAGSCEVPTTVKIRAGRTADAMVAPEFARRMVDAGAAAVAVHGRFASQFYRGESDRGVVEAVAGAVDVPVIGSGDVLSARAAVDMVECAGCAGSFVARGTYGNPWIFSDARARLRGEEQSRRSMAERLAAFCLHVRLLEATGAHMARARSLAGWYLRGVPNASSWRARAMTCVSVDDYLRLADEVALECKRAGLGCD